MEDESGIDTLLVSNSTTKKTYYFPSANNSLFAGTNYFVCQDTKAFHLLNLATGKQELHTPISHSDYSTETNQLLFLTKSDQVLTIMNLKTKVKTTIWQEFYVFVTKRRVVVKL